MRREFLSCRCWIAVVGLTAAAVLVRPTHAAGQTPSHDELAAVLAGKDPKAARGALAKLLALGDDGRKTAGEVLTGLVERCRRRHQTAARGLRGGFRCVYEPACKAAVIKRLRAAEKAGAVAAAFAFDYKRYPSLRQAMQGWKIGHDYQPGQAHMEARTELAVAAFNEAEVELVRGFGGTLRGRGPGGAGFAKTYLDGTLVEKRQPISTVKYTIVDPLVAWTSIATSILARHKALTRAEADYHSARSLARTAGVTVQADESSALPPLVTAAAALLAGRYADALKHRPAEGDDVILFTRLVHRHVLIRNAQLCSRWSRSEKRLLHRVNLIRLSANIHPLLANQKLHAAALEHSKWQSDSRRLGHGRPEAKMLTAGHRCRARGYRGMVMENISYAPLHMAIWAWRVDAAHHRCMLHPRLYAAGLGMVKSIITLNAGNLIEDRDLAKLLAGTRPTPRPRPRRPAGDG